MGTLANEASVGRENGYVGTKDLLSSLLQIARFEDEELRDRAAAMLLACDVSLDDLADEVSRLPDYMVAEDSEPHDPQWSPRAKGVMRFAQSEARRAQHPCVALEHVMIALVAEPEGECTELLRFTFDLTPEGLRESLDRL